MVDHPMIFYFSLLARPSDEMITGGEGPGSGPEAQRTQQGGTLMPRTQKITTELLGHFFSGTGTQ